MVKGFLKLLALVLLLAMMVGLGLFLREAVFVGNDPYLEDVR